MKLISVLQKNSWIGRRLYLTREERSNGAVNPAAYLISASVLDNSKYIEHLVLDSNTMESFGQLSSITFRK